MQNEDTRFEYRLQKDGKKKSCNCDPVSRSADAAVINSASPGRNNTFASVRPRIGVYRFVPYLADAKVLSGALLETIGVPSVKTRSRFGSVTALHVENAQNRQVVRKAESTCTANDVDQRSQTFLVPAQPALGSFSRHSAMALIVI